MAQEDWTLKRRLVAGDGTTVALAWLVALSFGTRSLGSTFAVTAAATAIGLLFVWRSGLLLARRTTLRATEMRLVAWTSIGIGAGLVLADRIALGTTVFRIGVGEAAAGAVLTFVGLTIERGVWRAVMRAARHDGRHVRPVLLLGANSDAQRLVRLYEDHPEYGFRVIGLLAGWEDAQRNHLGQMWMGTIDEVERIIDHHAVTGVVIAAGAVDADTGESIVRALHRRGVHVHWSTGMSGVSNARVRALPLAREPIFYLEAHRRSTADVAGKRAFDLIGAVAGVVLLAPVLLLIAAIVKFGDGGPIFYRQARVGRNGKIFKVIKFRTMRVDADRQLEALATLNERKGPLFKLERDPRVTRAGKFLRLSSLDELPQLFNVLRGEMSLVGPRPALPSEITQFDERLRGRDVVRPGITGLWQVEARDSPSFEAYRRLDLFYVENWSLWGDVAVLLDTVEHMVGRVYRAVRKDDTAPAVTTVVPAAVEPDSPIVRSA